MDPFAPNPPAAPAQPMQPMLPSAPPPVAPVQMTVDPFAPAMPGASGVVEQLPVPQPEPNAHDFQSGPVPGYSFDPGYGQLGYGQPGYPQQPGGDGQYGVPPGAPMPGQPPVQVGYPQGYPQPYPQGYPQDYPQQPPTPPQAPAPAPAGVPAQPSTSAPQQAPPAALVPPVEPTPPAPPTLPEQPADFDPYEAANNPESASARYVREAAQYNVDMARYGNERLQYERDLLAFGEQQRTYQEGLRGQVVQDLRTRFPGVPDAELSDFLGWASGPGLNDVAAWFTAYRATRGQQPAPSPQTPPAQPGYAADPFAAQRQQAFQQAVPGAPAPPAPYPFPPAVAALPGHSGAAVDPRTQEMAMMQEMMRVGQGFDPFVPAPGYGAPGYGAPMPPGFGPRPTGYPGGYPGF